MFFLEGQLYYLWIYYFIKKIYEIKKRLEFFKIDFKSFKRGYFMYFWLKIFMKIYIFKWELKYLEMNKKFIYKKCDKF